MSAPCRHANEHSLSRVSLDEHKKSRFSAIQSSNAAAVLGLHSDF